MVSKILALSHTDHLLQTVHIFKYLDTYEHNDLDFYTMYHNAEIVDVARERIETMRNLYVNARE